MRITQFLLVLSLGLLGLVGGCLILSQDGFTTSSKRSHWEIFVPAPQAYVMAAIMFALSVLASIWVLQQVRAKVPTYVACAALYMVAANNLTRLLSQVIQ